MEKGHRFGMKLRRVRVGFTAAGAARRRSVRVGCAATDVNSRAEARDTALMFAAFKGHAQIISPLLLHGGNVYAKARNGWTARKAARAGLHAEIAAKLRRAELEAVLRELFSNAQGHWCLFLRRRSERAKRRTSPALANQYLLIFDMPLPHHVHRFNAFESLLRCLKSLEALRRSHLRT